MEIDLNQIGNWKVHSMAAGYGSEGYTLGVYKVSLKRAIQEGCCLIDEVYGKHYKPASVRRLEDGTIRYEGADPWYVDVKEVVNND